MDWLKEWWPIIVAMLLGAVGFGKMSEENSATKKKVREIKEQLDAFGNENPMTLTHCKERQDQCHTIQAVYHGGLEKDVDELRINMQKELDDLRGAVKHMKSCNDTQHSKIIERGDAQHRDIINHILDINGNGKK